MTKTAPVLTGVRLKDVCDRVTVGHVGPMTDEYVADGVPFLRSQNIAPFHLNLDDVKFVSRAFHQKLRKSALHPGDVVVVRTGYPGTACVIPSSLPESNCADVVIMTPSAALNPYYLAAVFNSAWGRAAVAGNLVGVAQQHFNVTMAKALVVPMQSRRTQDRIARILSAYDRLVENDLRRIRVMEDMAAALYQEWFIKLHFPGHEKVRLVHSSLGEVPEGWEVTSVGDAAALVSRGPSLSYTKDGGIPVINQRCIRDGEIELAAIRYAKPLAERKGDLYLRRHDILVNSMGVGTLGRVSRNVSILEPMIIHNCITVVRPDRDRVSSEYLFYWLRDRQPRFESLSVGATGQTSLRIESIQETPITLPGRALLAAFSKHVIPMWDLVGALKRRSNVLRRTRDLLLPRLISGELDVSDLDIAISAGAA